MQPVDTLELESEGVRHSDTHPRLSFLKNVEKHSLWLLPLLVLLALIPRLYDLGAAGFAEDETNKIFALRAYEQGDFTVNAEHPMLMKMLCYGSLHATALWNRTGGQAFSLFLSEETALRLPNAVFGALTVIPIFLLTCGLFGFRIGLLTAFFWASGLNAIWFNRVTKEDTLLLFFLMTGFYLYHCAKAKPIEDMAGQERFYSLAGLSFGLMICAKYFPHFFGLNQLFYHLIGYNRRSNRPLTRQMLVKYFGAVVLAFILFNPAVFAPQTWRYLIAYSNEDLITHHGYLVMDHLFMNDMSSTPNGMPWYFYFLFLAVKFPLPLVIAFLAGAVEVFRHRGEPTMARGYMFLRLMLFFWLFPMAIMGAKFLRYTLPLMPVIYMTAAIGVWAIGKGVVAVAQLLSQRLLPIVKPLLFTIVAFFALTPALITVMNLPYPSLYVNELGGKRIGYFFPHDEFYDLGARESIAYLAKQAPPGATVASEIPGVMQYYLEKYRRTDIKIEILSHPQFDLQTRRPDYVLLQRGRIYVENQAVYHYIEENFMPIHTSKFFGENAAQLYRLNPNSP